MTVDSEPFSGDTAIWRYIDLARYVGLLERGLFFSRATNFQDPWEGSFGGRDVWKFRDQRQHLTRDDIEKEWNSKLRTKHSNLSKIGVSCWHANDSESAALWELYMPQGLGIAVTSTIDRVHAALSGAGRPVTTQRVTYVNYDDLEVTEDPLKLLKFKRLEFSHEKEVRFAIYFRDDEMNAIESLNHSLDQRKNRVLNVGPPHPVIISGLGYSSNDPTITTRVALAGVHLETQKQTLLERVVLAPNVSYATRRAVLAVTEAFEVDKVVIAESTMDRVPFDRLKFVDE